MHQEDANQTHQRPEKPKILGPKPVIASKPKIIPPINPKLQRQVREEQGIKKPNPTRETIKEKQTDCFPLAENFQSYVQIQKNIQENYTSKPEHYENKDKQQQKAPNSPSTVCCSILSTGVNDCCGALPTSKKELNGKTISKNESLDSNSSDSGGFKDFVQLQDYQAEKDDEKHRQESSHQRKKSQPDFLEREQQKCHQRTVSQPDYMSHEVRQSYAQNKQNFIANAQALAQYLPQTEQKLFARAGFDKTDEGIRQQISRFTYNEKQEEIVQKQRPNFKIQSHIQQSTKKLEEILNQRIERDKLVRKAQSCVSDGESSQDIEQKMNVQKQIQAKLQADLQQTVKHIQQIQSLELRLPQNRKWSEVCIYEITKFVIL